MTAARKSRSQFGSAVRIRTPTSVRAVDTGVGASRCDRFVSGQLQEAQALQLVVEDPAWQQALRNYMLVAYHAASGGPRALPMAHYQQLVAYVDETIFDAHLPGESPSERVHRLAAIAAYLSCAMHGVTPLRMPQMHGAAHVVTAAAAIERMRNLYQQGSDERIFTGWVRALVALFAASVEEQRPWSCARPLDCDCHAGTPLQQSVQQALAQAPAAIAAELASPAALMGEHAERCVTILLRLCCTAASIGAGGLFWSAALVNREAVTEDQLQSLQEACALLDYLVRLDNDLSDAMRLDAGDRDGKTNCVTIAMGRSTSVQDRARAIEAAQQCRAWLNELFEAALKQLLADDNSMGCCMARGAAMGEAVYTELGHFKEVSAEQMNEVARALDERWR